MTNPQSLIDSSCSTITGILTPNCTIEEKLTLPQCQNAFDTICAATNSLGNLKFTLQTYPLPEIGFQQSVRIHIANDETNHDHHIAQLAFDKIQRFVPAEDRVPNASRHSGLVLKDTATVTNVIRSFAQEVDRKNNKEGKPDSLFAQITADGLKL